MAHYNSRVHPTCAWGFGRISGIAAVGPSASHMRVGIWFDFVAGVERQGGIIPYDTVVAWVTERVEAA